MRASFLKCCIWVALGLSPWSQLLAASELEPGLEPELDLQLDSKQTIKFDIPATSLAQALITLARQAQVSLVSPAELVGTLQAPQLTGRYDVAQALQHLLAKTPLSFIVQADGNIIIAAKPQLQAQAQTLQETTVQSRRDDFYHPLEEVLVTAQKQSQNLQQVPMAITNIDKHVLDRGRISSLGEASLQVPGLSVSSYSLGQPSIHMRGIGSNDDGAAMDSSVVMFVDDIYIGRISALDMSILDIERVEALRGPQGTLYGKNAIGGAINVVSIRPTNKTQAKASLGLGNFNRKEASLLLNGALDQQQQWLARVLISHEQNDGWQSNVLYPGSTQMGGASTGARAKFSYDSNTNWRVFWSFDLGREDLNSTGRIPVASRSPLPVIDSGNSASGQQLTTDIFAQLGGDYRHATNDLQGYTDRIMGGFSQKIDWDLGDIQVSSISGFRDSQFDWLEDSSGLPNSITRRTVDLNVAEDHRQYSQELRLQWQASKEFSVMAGAYYLHESTQRRESFFFDDSTAISRQDNQSNNFAVFGKIEQQLNQNHFLSLGGRINVDQKHLKQEAVANNAPAIILQDFNHEQSQSWRDFSPRLAYRYQHNESLMLYTSISKGIKSGGFQGVPGTLDSAARTINPESAWEFEMGIKTHGFEDRLRLNIATFYTRYKDLQVVQFRTIDNFGVFETSNAASAKLLGLEAEFIWSANEQFSVFGSYAFLDAVYDQFNAISGEDFTGNSLRQAPRHSASLAAEYQQNIAAGQLNFYLNYRYQGESYREPNNAITIQPAFRLLDANLSFKPTEQSWQLNLWAKNLTDEAYITHLYVIGGNDYALYGTPRSYGLSLEFQI